MFNWSRFKFSLKKIDFLKLTLVLGTPTNFQFLSNNLLFKLFHDETISEAFEDADFPFKEFSIVKDSEQYVTDSK
jgi:hypothetical protein